MKLLNLGVCTNIAQSHSPCLYLVNIGPIHIESDQRCNYVKLEWDSHEHLTKSVIRSSWSQMTGIINLDYSQLCCTCRASRKSYLIIIFHKVDQNEIRSSWSRFEHCPNLVTWPPRSGIVISSHYFTQYIWQVDQKCNYVMLESVQTLLWISYIAFWKSCLVIICHKAHDMTSWPKVL